MNAFRHETNTYLSSLQDSDVIKNGIIKSVQQGYVSLTTSNTLRTYEINISPVNVNKSILILNISNGVPYKFNLNKDKIEIKYGSSGSIELYWQVIEFY